MIHCPVCSHRLRDEIEAQFLAGSSVEALVKTYGPRVQGLNQMLLNRHLNRHLRDNPKAIVLQPLGHPPIELPRVEPTEFLETLRIGISARLQLELASQLKNPTDSDPKRLQSLVDTYLKLTGGESQFSIDAAIATISRAGFEILDPTGMLSAEVVDAAQD